MVGDSPGPGQAQWLEDDHRILGGFVTSVHNLAACRGLVLARYLSPKVRYSLRTAFFGVFVQRPSSLPPLRGDLECFRPLFTNATENFLHIVDPYKEEVPWPLGRAHNGMFESVDMQLYYSILRSYRPAKVVEIGTGNSAWTAKEALEKNGDGQIITIDPSPRTRLPNGITQIRSRVEDVPLEVFQTLGAGDVVFIDSSHHAGEVAYHLERILPTLPKGCLVHVHDFYYPYQGGFAQDPDRFTETDAWLQLLSDGRGVCEVITCSPYVRFEKPQLLLSLVTSYAWNPFRIPGSLWIQKHHEPG